MSTTPVTKKWQQIIAGTYANKNCNFPRNATVESFHDFDKKISWSTSGFLNLDLAALIIYVQLIHH
jgi:hypothetical protein